MTKIQETETNLSTDVLIIGGGIGGLTAAIRIKELSPDTSVLLVDKQTIGWGGKANKGAGVLWMLMPDQEVDAFVEYHVRNIGVFLNDQDLLRNMAKESYGAVEKLAEWGVEVLKAPDGEYVARRLPYGWSLAAADLNMMRHLRSKAVKTGIKTIDKTQVVELLKEGERVTGAIGFSLLDGRVSIFRAKATILANGDCDFGVMRMWANACGDGVVAAYNAGAEMRNAEFANFYDVMDKTTGIPFVFGFNHLYNGKGEHITPKYVPFPEPDIPISIILGMEKEVMEGRGPIYIDLEEVQKAFAAGGGGAQWERKHFKALHDIEVAKLGQYRSSKRVEVSLGFTGELSSVRVDSEMKTTVPGLWAIGDTSYAGSSWGGAVEAPPGRMRGSGIMNAVLAGLMAAPSVAKYNSAAPAPKDGGGDLGRLEETIFAPLKHGSGYQPTDMIRAIQEVVVPIRYSLRRSKDRLEEALSKVAEVQKKIPDLCATDFHGLGKCHEARCMALCAEIGFRAALERTESRGWHYREDYPERDDKNWLKWVIVKKQNGSMAVSTEPIPIDRYKIKPGTLVSDAVVDHDELIGVSPEMIDWWWVNMEKGYPLWEPNDHKGFTWEVPPPVNGYLGAIQIAEEKMGPGPVLKLRIRWDDPETCAIPRVYDHAILCSGVSPDGRVMAQILHQYEATPRGTRMRSTMRYYGPVLPGRPEIWKKHDRAEVSTFPTFLPDLYRLWQVVKDPTINRQCCLSRSSKTNDR